MRYPASEKFEHEFRQPPPSTRQPAAQVPDLVGGRRPRRVAGKSLLAGLEKLFRKR